MFCWIFLVIWFELVHTMTNAMLTSGHVAESIAVFRAMTLRHTSRASCWSDLVFQSTPDRPTVQPAERLSQSVLSDRWSGDDRSQSLDPLDPGYILSCRVAARTELFTSPERAAGEKRSPTTCVCVRRLPTTAPSHRCGNATLITVSSATLKEPHRFHMKPKPPLPHLAVFWLTDQRPDCFRPPKGCRRSTRNLSGGDVEAMSHRVAVDKYDMPTSAHS